MAENASISVKKGKLFQTQSKFLNYEELYNIYIYISGGHRLFFFI